VIRGWDAHPSVAPVAITLKLPLKACYLTWAKATRINPHDVSWIALQAEVTGSILVASTIYLSATPRADFDS
jgi:hypothetical protein